MKNYTYGWVLKDKGYVEVAESEYTAVQMDMKQYIEMLSDVVVAAQCGWDSVAYKVMQHIHGGTETYMVLCVDGAGRRWIPITGNSKGCNLQVLGENLW